jgi:hypothetical protein
MTSRSSFGPRFLAFLPAFVSFLVMIPTVLGIHEYVRGDVYSNTVESVFSLLKRGVMGTFHSLSRKHLPNYLGEFEFRYNTRKMNDGARVSAAVKSMQGKRLEYRQSVDNPPNLVG